MDHGIHAQIAGMSHHISTTTKNPDGGITLVTRHGSHMDASAEAAEHTAFATTIEALYGLGDAARSDAAGDDAKVFIASGSGDWSDPSIWDEGQVPGSNALVYIPAGVEVSYDVLPSSEAPLFSIYVEGTLDVATDQDTVLLVDTIFTAAGSRLTIGDEGDRIEDGHTATIVIRDDTKPADERDWDPGQFSKGIVTHGEVRIAGADKTSKLTLAENAEAGDEFITLAEEPLNWEIGDKIVLQGTYQDSAGDHASNSVFHDEELLITDVLLQTDGTARVLFENLHDGGSTLRFEHAVPDGIDGGIYVANMSRSVTIMSAGGEDTLAENGGDLHDRGHVMFMHNDDVRVFDAAFTDLGRTDKSELRNDDDNMTGRYAIHLHRAGVDDIAGEPAVIDGISVEGSPGWGIVHHQSHLNILDSVVFDTGGSGIVAEAGDEIGIWRDNLVMKVTNSEPDVGDSNAGGLDFWVPGNDLGKEVTDPSSTLLFDFGRSEAYWVQGAGQVKLIDNVAASAPTAINFFADSWELANKDADSVLVGNLRIREEDGTLTETDAYRALKAAGYADDDRIAVGAAPPKGIDGFEASNVGQGIVTWLVQRNPDGDADLNPVFTEGDGGWAPVEHDARVEIKDVNLWNVSKNGILLAHSSQIDIIDATVNGAGDVAFNDTSGALDALSGVAFGATSDSQDVTFSNSSATGFAETGPLEIKIGPSEAERIDGTDGQDKLDANTKSHDPVYFNGGAGDDFLRGAGGNDILIGGDGNDVISASGRQRLKTIEDERPDIDLIIAGDGDDIIRAQSADNWLSLVYGGEGYDQLQIIGGDGYGMVLNRFSAYEQSIEVLAQHEGDPNWQFSGTATADHIDLRGAVIYSTTKFEALDGDDIYFGVEEGEDALGGKGSDFLSGEGGADRLFGGEGNDILRGGAGPNQLFGEGGRDVFQSDGRGLQMIRDFDVSEDRLELAIDGIEGLGDLKISVVQWNPSNGKNDFESTQKGQSPDEDALYITWGDNTPPPDGTFINIGTFTADGIILGGLTDLNGVDIIFTDTLYTPEADFTHALAVAEIPDWVDPADYAQGIDQRRLEDAPETNVTLAELGVDVSTLDRVDFSEKLTFQEVMSRVSPTIQASKATDGGSYMVGDEMNNRLHGSNSDDVMEGGEGDDFLALQTGFDVAFGGSGDDVFRIGLRNNAADKNVEDALLRPDKISGGSGHDIVRAGSGGGLGFDDFSRGENGIEEIWAGSIYGADYKFDRSLDPDNTLDFRGINILNYGGLGASGAGQGVKIRAGDGNDIVFGNHKDNRIFGEDDDDRLSGESGDDWIEGGQGSDVLRGGSGTNTLWGDIESERKGPPAELVRDIFQISAGENATIMDFQPGVDQIQSEGALASVTEIIEPGPTKKSDDIISTRLTFDDGSTVRLDRVNPDEFDTSDVTTVAAFEDWAPGANTEADWAAIDDPSLRGARFVRDEDGTGTGSAPDDMGSDADNGHGDMGDSDGGMGHAGSETDDGDGDANHDDSGMDQSDGATDEGEDDMSDQGNDSTDMAEGGTEPVTRFFQAEDFGATEGVGVYDKGATIQIGGTQDGDWVRYDAIDFGESDNTTRIDLTYASKRGGALEIRIGSPEGQIIGTHSTDGTGGWTTFETVELELAPVSGTQDMYFVFRGSASSVMDIDHFEIKGLAGSAPVDPADPVPINTPPVLVQDLPDVVLDEGKTLQIALSDIFADADPGDALTYSVEGADWVSVDGTTLNIVTPDVDGDAAADITVRATDSFGALIEDSFAVRVNDTTTTAPDPIDDPSGPLLPDAIDLTTGPSAIDDLSDALIVDHTDAFALSEGTIALSFVAEDVNGRQGLYSKDATSYGEGGHLTIWLDEGEVVARLQSDSKSYEVSGGDIEAGAAHEFALTFGPDGMVLYVDGTEVDTSAYSGGLIGNVEPIVIGASQWSSSAGTADRLVHEFKGEIASAKVFDAPLTAAEVQRLSDSAADTGGDDDTPPVENTVPVVDAPIDDQQIDEGEAGEIDLARVFVDVDPDDLLTFTINGPDWVSLDGEMLRFQSPEVDGDTTEQVTIRATDRSGALIEDRFDITINDTTAPDPDPIEDPVDPPAGPIDGTPISLTVERNTFSRNGTDAKSWGDDGVTLQAYDALGNAAKITYKETNPAGNPQPEDGVGAEGLTSGNVNGSRNSYQTAHIRELDVSESMVIDFAGGVADVTFQLGHLGAGEGPTSNPLPETGLWTALDENGDVISTGLIGPDESVDGLKPGSYGIYDFAVVASRPVFQLVLEATEFDHGNTPFDLSDLDKNGNSSEFTLRGVTYTRVDDSALIDPPVDETDDPLDEGPMPPEAPSDDSVPDTMGLTNGPLDVDDLSDALILDHTDAFALSEGTIALSFVTDDVNGRQGLFSKDATSYGDGGHVTIWLHDGEVVARLQSDSKSYEVSGGDIEAGSVHDFALTFGPDGMVLYVDGAEVDTNAYAGGLIGNVEPIVIGASQWSSSAGTADQLVHDFKGEIVSARVFDAPLTAAEVQLISDPAADTGGDGDTAPVDNAAPVVNAPIDDQQIDESEVTEFNLDEVFRDADFGDMLAYTVSGPDWVTVDGSILRVVAPQTSENLSANITVTATDASGATATETFFIKVMDQAADDAPLVPGESVALSAVSDTLFDNGDGTKTWGDEVDVFAVAPDGSNAEVVVDTQFVNVGLGVVGPNSRWSQIDNVDLGGSRDPIDAASEKLVIDFGGYVTDVEIGIGQIGLTEGPRSTPETGKWTALDADGNFVDQGLIGPDVSGADLSGVGPKDKIRLPHDIETNQPFARLEIEATHFGHGEAGFRLQGSNTDSSDFNLMDISFTRVTETDAQTNSEVADFGVDDLLASLTLPDESNAALSEQMAMADALDDARPEMFDVIW